MSTDTHHARSSPIAERQFQTEIDAVREHMSSALSDLGSPLGDLVRPRVHAADPPLRAALVLCVGYNGPDGSPHHRIHLAAALEMLHLALGIHQLLVDSAASNPLSHPPEDQRTFIGSTILAGDFCFSRSAQMAARTENPKIVTVFAQALQDVSEGSLRELFSDQNGPQPAQGRDRDEVLLRSGAEAALELSNLDAVVRPSLLQLSESTIQFALTSQGSGSPCRGPFHDLPATHQQRWRAFCTWLDAATAARPAGQIS